MLGTFGSKYYTYFLTNFGADSGVFVRGGMIFVEGSGDRSRSPEACQGDQGAKTPGS